MSETPQVQTTMTAADLPYPNGWFAVAYSDEVEPGAVISRRLCGQDIVIWRNAEGELRVQDAYCLHLGANIGVGGWVNGDAVVCPFHGWQYGADGYCVKIPYEKRPMRVQLKTWEVRDYEPMVLVWFDAQGRPPTWEMPKTDWEGYAVRHQDWTINSHPQEICENAADGAHFQFVHKFPNVADVQAREDGNTIWFDISMRPLSEDHDPADRAPNEPEPFDISGKADSNVTGVHGPGLVFNEVYAKQRHLRNELYVTPVDHDRVILRGVHALNYDDKTVDVEEKIEKTKGWAAFDAWEDDLPIWENKIYRPKPYATHPSEIAIVAFRKWYSRWYDEGEVDATAATAGRPAASSGLS